MSATETFSKYAQYFVLSNGSRLCYATFGADDGIPLLYFHGWPSSRLQARSVDQLGKELGFTIYAPDRPGIGQSDHIHNRQLSDWPKNIQELLTHLKIEQKVHLMGVSGGGPYAIACACLLNAQVASTTIVCGAPPLAELTNKDDMILPYRALLKMRPLLPALMKPTMPLTKWAASKTYKDAPLSWYAKTLSEADQRILSTEESHIFALYSFREAFSKNAPGLVADADTYSTPWNLDYAQIQHPIHFWHGTEDKNIPFKMAQHLAAQIPQSITHWLDGEGHYSVPILHSREILECILENKEKGRVVKSS